MKQLKHAQKNFTLPSPLPPPPSCPLLLRQQIISTSSIVADWQTVEGPVSCLSVFSLSFCVLSFQSASTDCNLAKQVSGLVQRGTTGRRAGPDPLSQPNFLDSFGEQGCDNFGPRLWASCWI